MGITNLRSDELNSYLDGLNKIRYARWKDKSAAHLTIDWCVKLVKTGRSEKLLAVAGLGSGMVDYGRFETQLLGFQLGELAVTMLLEDDEKHITSIVDVFSLMGRPGLRQYIDIYISKSSAKEKVNAKKAIDRYEKYMKKVEDNRKKKKTE